MFSNWVTEQPGRMWGERDAVIGIIRFIPWFFNMNAITVSHFKIIVEMETGVENPVLCTGVGVLALNCNSDYSCTVHIRRGVQSVWGSARWLRSLISGLENKAFRSVIAWHPLYIPNWLNFCLWNKMASQTFANSSQVRLARTCLKSRIWRIKVIFCFASRHVGSQVGG